MRKLAQLLLVLTALTITLTACGAAASGPSKPVQDMQTSHVFTGTGNETTPTFKVPNDWRIVWSCHPSGTYATYGYAFDIFAFDTHGNGIDAIDSMCAPGQLSGSSVESLGGNVYLQIDSSGNWTVEVQQ